MDYVDWENKTILQIDVEYCSIQTEKLESKCEIDFFPVENDQSLTDYFFVWMQTQEYNDLILSYIDNGLKKHYHLELCIPIYLTSNSGGYISTCKIKTKRISEITRSMKIYNLLK